MSDEFDVDLSGENGAGPEPVEEKKKRTGAGATKQIAGLLLRKLKPDELPVPSQHYVVWGSELMNDIRDRPVTVAAQVTEDEYVEAAREHTAELVLRELKNPLHQAKDRVERSAENARWRYLGYVCGQVESL